MLISRDVDRLLEAVLGLGAGTGVHEKLSLGDQNRRDVELLIEGLGTLECVVENRQRLGNLPESHVLQGHVHLKKTPTGAIPGGVELSQEPRALRGFGCLPQGLLDCLIELSQEKLYLHPVIHRELLQRGAVSHGSREISPQDLERPTTPVQA